jgi:hypothetical protein
MEQTRMLIERLLGRLLEKETGKITLRCVSEREGLWMLGGPHWLGIVAGGSRYVTLMMEAVRLSET